MTTTAWSTTAKATPRPIPSLLFVFKGLELSVEVTVAVIVAVTVNAVVALTT